MEGPRELAPEALTELTTAINLNLSARDSKALLNTLLSFPDVFDNSLGNTSVALHNIDTGDSPPIRQYPRRLPYHHRAEAEKQVNDMLSQGVIQPSISPWSSPSVLVKKNDGSYRFCKDFRKLTSITKVEVHPLPRVDDLLEALNGNTIFSTLDFRSGYWQVGMHPDACGKTAFSSPHHHHHQHHQLFKHGSPFSKAGLQGAMHLKYYKNFKRANNYESRQGKRT